MSQKSKLSLEEKVKIICKYKKGEGRYQQMRTWTLRFEKMGEAGLEDQRGKRKKDQVPRTELEKAWMDVHPQSRGDKSFQYTNRHFITNFCKPG